MSFLGLIYGLAPVEGSGTATLATGTVDVADTKVTANTVVRLCGTVPGGTVGAHYLDSVTAGTGFTIKSTSSSDTSKVYYEIVKY